MFLELIRVGQSEKGTFGVLRCGEIPFALTLEEPWRDNEAKVSSIPPGLYECRRVLSPKFGEMFEVTHVPGRSHILFHKGNTLEDTEGCILVGEEFAGTAEQPMLAQSRRGYEEFMKLLNGFDQFELRIVEATQP